MYRSAVSICRYSQHILKSQTINRTTRCVNRRAPTKKKRETSPRSAIKCLRNFDYDWSVEIFASNMSNEILQSHTFFGIHSRYSGVNLDALSHKHSRVYCFARECICTCSNTKNITHRATHAQVRQPNKNWKRNEPTTTSTTAMQAVCREFCLVDTACTSA